MSRIAVVLSVLLCLILAACGSQSPTVAVPVLTATAEQDRTQPASSPLPGASAILPQPLVEQAPSETASTGPAPSPSATPTPSLLLGANTQTPEPVKATGGTIEVRTPNTINGVGECVNTIPFRLEDDEGRTMSRGEGRIECEFEGKPIGGEGSSIVYHVLLELDAVLDGELLPATPDRPHGWMDAFLMVDGSITQYYSGYPPQATNPCPESSPCRTPSAQVVSLPFSFEEGSTISAPWTFVLHLE